MIDIRLGAQHLGKKVTLEDGMEGKIKAYNNKTNILFVIIEGKMIKYKYADATLC